MITKKLKNDNKIKTLYKELKDKYDLSEGQWALWCKRKKSKKDKEQIIIEAILTQRINWKNVELSMINLKKARADSLKDIVNIGPQKLCFLIRPSGFYQTKSYYLFHLAQFVLKNYSSVEKMQKENIKKLREGLLTVKGVGKETADDILLYALEKSIFVIDEYTRRFVKKYKIAKDLSYDYLQNLFQKNLPQSIRVYQDFHAIIVLEGKPFARGKVENKNI